MAKEIKNQKKEYDDEEETKLPLTPEGKDYYDFNLKGDETKNGVDAWIVSFNAKKKKKGYLNGIMYVSKNTFDLIYSEYVPAKLPPMVYLKFRLTYSQIQGYWLLTRLQMNLNIEVNFLYYRNMTVEEIYSDYKLNNQLEDSLFESE